MRALRLAALLCASAALAACGDDPGVALFGPKPSDTAPGGGEWKRVETVRPFRRSQVLTKEERRRATLLLTRDESVGPILRKAGQYTLLGLGPVTPAGGKGLVGAFAEVRLAQPVSGTYRLPGACVGLDGQFVHMPPTDYEFRRLQELMVSVGFADGRVFEAQPGLNASDDFEIVNAPKTWPRSCEKAAERGIGD